MTPVLVPKAGTFAPASTELRAAAAIAVDALEALAFETPSRSDAARYRFAADRLDRALRLPRLSRPRLLRASPAVLERSSRSRSLVEMIEAEPDDPQARLRLAKLLIRALIWQPETFPEPFG